MAIISNHRNIAHFDLDTFFVSVERLKNSSLVNKPVIVGGLSDRGVVAACSYETRAFGVHSAMPMKLALRLCPDAHVVRGDHDNYSHYSRMVTDIIRQEVPVLEKASIDEFYLDLTGMDKFFGCSKFTGELKHKIMKETGLPISYALASNKLISKVATNEAKPNGQIEIDYGQEKPYLAPLKIEKMPGIGDKTSKLLRQMGIDTIRTLSEIPLRLMESRFGKNGIDLSRKANGIDFSPVVPFSEQKSIGKEDTFENDTIDMQFLHSELVRMTENIAFQLRQQHKLCGCVTVKLRYSNFDTYTRQASISYTASDDVILQTAKELFKRLYDKRMLVRLIGVRLSDLVYGQHQIDLFTETEESVRLYQALDHIRTRFGEEAIFRGTAKHLRNPKCT
ncbi:DNA polymerase IV [Arcticibacter svalbardensis MN12-7]|uniref:DNA polymerase IV n=1 Tax=Arcticibacter svalbardensis MN12-7 TaxID=1150600 RepID=R9GMH1_9SPHI|nr:DNA polymerase IV [Arcticibacter svalbardensis]EOR92901.1 DNA polymerase IV [Arcticibacter svalbardensis MN12-7]